MMETSVFLSNRSQAVSTPAGESRDEWFDGNNVSADFMDDREQPTMQERRTGSDQLIRNHPP
ncbi:hypothetical protein C4C56_24450, partial [Salmonella enterica subsp. enterica serovar Enteritidis]|nr:hypothetical protein [Salmonella enterica subsp. enterica serovar Enteritidis]